MAVTVNGVLIAEALVVSEMERLRADYVAYVTQNGGEASEVQLREWAEENLIEAELLRQEAAATQPEPSEERARKWLAEHESHYAQVPEAELVARAKDDLRVRRLEKEMRKRVPKPSESEVRREYDAHAERYVTPERLRVSHICRLIGPGGSTKAAGYLELLRIKTDLASGALSWYEAIEASDTYQEDRGMFGALARGELTKEVDETLFALAQGQVSDVVELGGASLHLFRVLAVEPPAAVPFESVREGLGLSMFEQAYQSSLETLFDALRAKAEVRREA
jgi:parvulin-like peptidyl-prolyl isomerase